MELEHAGHPWPHPWDHYPFLSEDECVWVRYQDLDAADRQQVRLAVRYVSRALDVLTMPSGVA
jgi:hypothetical protein